LQIPRGGWLQYSPDGKQLAYNSVFREFRTGSVIAAVGGRNLALRFRTKATTKLTMIWERTGT